VRAPDIGATQTPPPSIAGFASFVGTLAGVVVLIGVLLAFDLFLANLDLRESSRHAAAEYRQGLAFLAVNEPASAADHFSAALTIQRDDVNYALALGEAQRRGGETDDAEATLKALLERAGNDGAVNLAMARVLAGDGRVAEAKAYFHRAIYGRWGADSLARRADARFALIDLLAAHGGGRDLLAELLPLEDVSPDSVAFRKKLGRWFLLAGSPARAANMFREVLRRDPRDGEAFDGMGEAALAQGNFRTAHADFSEAISLLPADSALAARLAVTDTLLAADPTARGLDSSERIIRGRALLGRMLAVLDPCVTKTPRPVVDAARALLADTTTAASRSDAAADTVTTTAGELWASYGATCPASGTDGVVRLLGIRVSQ
jgi:tetratricopeptide (TPR) repeat protein